MDTATTTAIAPIQLTQKVTSQEFKWPAGQESVTVRLDVTSFVTGSCRFIIEADRGDGKGFVFVQSADTFAGARGQRDGLAPSMLLLQEKIPFVKIRLSLEAQSGTPIVGLKTDAKEVV